ncbi:hypothetical protein HO133_002741 [Letharia lupina]|uniref:Uncharacterized protein n=1 Tax=Letharia lupina TaxID=560253 RepID=A0A8H6FAB9_9LECA|nr:uncharacterized protein HO133_002741 [Letharia lupina]KAF6221060.1 hypothetical protein HO133_002741 [Letharia lupina]
MVIYRQTAHLCILWLIYLSSQSQSSPLPKVEVNQVPETMRLNTENTATSPLREQFKNPAEILGILLLIGGDTIRKAIAQLAGPNVAPVAFSFGWVAYSFGALLSVWGDGRLLPEPDVHSMVINHKSGNTKQNESWVLGRLIRDLEMHFSTQKSKTKEFGGKSFHIIKLEAMDVWKKKHHWSGKDRPDPPAHDLIWWSFFGCVVLQLGLAVAPIFIDHSGNWRILLVTGAGTMLAIIHGSLPQCKEEKYECEMTEKGKDATFILTRGNSHQYVFVIHSPPENRTLNMEHLAVSRRIGGKNVMKYITAVLAACWIVLLIAIGGLEQDTWFLLMVGGIGMFHNLWVAGHARTTSAHGIPLDIENAKPLTDPDKSVMEGLMAAEKIEPGVGLALLKVYFPGRLRPDEDKWWAKKTKRFVKRIENERKKKGKKPKSEEEEESEGSEEESEGADIWL